MGLPRRVDLTGPRATTSTLRRRPWRWRRRRRSFGLLVACGSVAASLSRLTMAAGRTGVRRSQPRRRSCPDMLGTGRQVRDPRIAAGLVARRWGRVCAVMRRRAFPGPRVRRPGPCGLPVRIGGDIEPPTLVISSQLVAHAGGAGPLLRRGRRCGLAAPGPAATLCTRSRGRTAKVMCSRRGGENVRFFLSRRGPLASSRPSPEPAHAARRRHRDRHRRAPLRRCRDRPVRDPRPYPQQGSPLLEPDLVPGELGLS